MDLSSLDILAPVKVSTLCHRQATVTTMGGPQPEAVSGVVLQPKGHSWF